MNGTDPRVISPPASSDEAPLTAHSTEQARVETQELIARSSDTDGALPIVKCEGVAASEVDFVIGVGLDRTPHEEHHEEVVRVLAAVAGSQAFMKKVKERTGLALGSPDLDTVIAAGLRLVVAKYAGQRAPQAPERILMERVLKCHADLLGAAALWSRKWDKFWYAPWFRRHARKTFNPRMEDDKPDSDDRYQTAITRFWEEIAEVNTNQTVPFDVTHRFAALLTHAGKRVCPYAGLPTRRQKHVYFHHELPQTTDENDGDSDYDFSDRFASEHIPGPEDAASSAQLQKFVEYAIDQLPEEQRRVFVLHLEGVRPSEIAVTLAKKEGTVHPTIKHAKANVLRFLSAMIGAKAAFDLLPEACATPEVLAALHSAEKCPRRQRPRR
jgi:RNA polymerase sigma factor (sigma-70 family)